MAKKSKLRAASAANASNQPIEQVREEPESHAPSAPDEPVSSPQTEPELATEALRQELSEVRELARSLYAAVQDVKAQSARNELMRSAMQDVKADVRAAQQAALMTPAGAGAAPYVDPHGVGREGKCGPCECVSDGCCCFDIKIASVRAAKPQIEPADMGDIPGLINALEVQMFFSVNGRGILLPGLGSTFDLRCDGAPGGPGAHLTVERVVDRVCFTRGTTVSPVLKVQVREEDAGLERPIGMKDEIGEGEGMITLDCCMDKIYPPMPIEVYLIHGGEGRGMVQVFFYAERVCC